MIDLTERERCYDEGLRRVKQYLSKLDGSGVVKKHRLQAKTFLIAVGVLHRLTKKGTRAFPPMKPDL